MLRNLSPYWGSLYVGKSLVLILFVQIENEIMNEIENEIKNKIEDE